MKDIPTSTKVIMWLFLISGAMKLGIILGRFF